MANVNVVSFSLVDYTGNIKSMPLHFPTGMTLANIQAGVTAYAPLLDAVIDAAIDSVEVTLQLTLPGGIKGESIGGNTVREGALLTFDAADTSYAHSIFVPSWSNAGFAGNEILTEDEWQDFYVAIVSGLGTGSAELKPSDKAANDLTALIRGLRKFRK